MGASVIGGATVGVVGASGSMVDCPEEGHTKTVDSIANVIKIRLAIVTVY